MKCAVVVTVVAALALASCRGPEVDKPTVTSAAGSPEPASVSPPAIAAVPPEAGPTAPPAAAIAEAASGAMYVCVKDSAGRTQSTPIDMEPQVAKLCKKAPEMGPCQYERATCRRSGGRVFTADGTEITLQTEAEYDRRVMRVHMKSN